MLVAIIIVVLWYELRGRYAKISERNKQNYEAIQKRLFL